MNKQVLIMDRKFVVSGSIRSAILSPRFLKWLTMIVFMLALGDGRTAGIEAAETYPIVDTNQVTCYDSNGIAAQCSGTGYDADYDGNQPSYTLSEDGLCVTDNVTGLIWTSRVDLNDDGVVDVSDKLIQSEAVTYCSGLSYNNDEWRLPTVKELYSLIQFSGQDPSGYEGTDTSSLVRFIDDNYFERAFGDISSNERVIDAQYATTTLYLSPKGTINGASTMFGVNFVDGRIKGYPVGEESESEKKYYVHCVAGSTTYGENDFQDNGDSTISDLATGLMWEQDDYQSTDWDDAVSHCENATTGGYSDWRLPNVKELQSIVDYDRAPDYTNSAAIDANFNATSFANEGGDTEWGYYWASTSHVNSQGYGRNGTYVSFGRALGYYQGNLTDVHGAGAQRSNDKSNVSTGSSSADLGYGAFYYNGPQGDILRLNNMARCVRDHSMNASSNQYDLGPAINLLLLSD